jgi:dimethylamine monooxygenase subunit A
VATSLPYVPLDERGWRLAMGMRPLEESAWLEVDEHFEAELALKAALLASNYDVVVATNPEGDEGSRELLDEILRFLSEHHPGLSRTVTLEEHPIVQASRLVQEDLCVLAKDDAWRLRAACVCFPSRWLLASKIGTTLDEIHAPVPGFDESLARPTKSFFDRLTPERAFWRLNWTLLDSPTLFQPTSARVAPSGDLADWYFRVERQTLRQLPKSRAVVFTIRTYVTPAVTLSERDEQFLPTLLHALESAPPSTQSYKGWTGVAQRLRDALGAQ